MLLGRNASGLYWMSRYFERAENTARLIDTGLRIALMRTQSAADELRSVIVSAGVESAFLDKHDEFTVATVTDFMLRDSSNPSSVTTCIDAGRMNARMVRTALTRDAWEAINEGWMALKSALSAPIDGRDLPAVLNLIKRETAQIRGSIHGTQLRNEIYDFAQLGTYIERADDTARILDVKYYVLLPSAYWVGSSLDTSQWESILRSVSAHRSYRWVYGTQYRPSNIADYLILNARMPRSLAFSYRMIKEHLDCLARDYGEDGPRLLAVEENMAKLAVTSIEHIFESGLHEFLASFIRDNNRLGQEVAEHYRFV
ncbi:alpha-E domain-containing protein [Lysobacter sp. CA199]|uniref:alpha-E domain-containing protein n=1 Tax=Lysobacter sp. CA199 TaxID=3455608 RepID=UPI003F8D1ED7